MGHSTINSFVIICLLASVHLCKASDSNAAERPQQDSLLRVYLPREVTVEENAFSLGQVGIVLGDEPIATKANAVALGRFSVPGQRVVLDKSVVLSRLACSGIPVSRVKLTGAEEVTIQRRQQVIKGSEFVEMAGSFLKKNDVSGFICRMNLIKTPKDLILPGTSENVNVSPRLVTGRARNKARVRIVVAAGGKQIGARDIVFQLKYNCRRAVALADIAEGETISPQNVKIEQAPSNYPEPAGWTAPYGLVARRQIAANCVLQPHMTGPVKPQVLIKRKQAVLIRIEKPGLLVTAAGTALQDGCPGECIKVQNVDSKRIIMARVNEDGTVEPVL
ncbi:MAG: flagellar basal body P-ring formation chaperone FlgA [Planctomycetota bacterium]